jgi:Na+-transporting NADH:ubiquinone oxidoreductase subunit NqrB
MSQPVATIDLLPPPAQKPAWKRFLSVENRYLPPLFITLILLVGQLSFGMLESYKKTLLAIGTSIAAELFLSKLMTGKWPHLASAYISGISVGILVRSPAFWPYALCALLSISSKYVLRYRGRHLWNPSNFGISALLFLAGDAAASLSIQWGNYVLPLLVIWALGATIVFRVRRLHITGTYVGAFLIFAFVRAWIMGNPWQAEIAPLTGPEYQLFIFFMITDPKTTVKGVRGQCLVAFSVALAEMVLRLNQVVYAPFYALFLVGPSALLIEMWVQSRTRRIGQESTGLTAAGAA